MTHYPIDSPLSWYQDNPRTIGCTACEWTALVPAACRQWPQIERLHKNHVAETHQGIPVRQAPKTLTDPEVHAIYRACGSYQEIAKAHGVDYHVVQRIKQGISYKHVTGGQPKWDRPFGNKRATRKTAA